MNIYELTTDAALESLRSSTNGLSTAEAARRLAEFGPNRIERPARASTVQRLLREFTHFFAVILWLAAFLALVADVSQPGQGMRLVNVQLCRSSRESVFTVVRQWNALLVAGMGLEVALILVIVYTPLGNLVFGTAPIGADAWLYMLPFAIAMVTGEEIRKWIVRRLDGRRKEHVEAVVR